MIVEIGMLEKMFVAHAVLKVLLLAVGVVIAMFCLMVSMELKKRCR